MLNKIEKINILGVGISAINMDDALQGLEHYIKTKTKNCLCMSKPYYYGKPKK